MQNDHAQFDARNPLNRGASSAKAKPKGLLLAAAGLGGAVVGWFMPLGLVESVTTATGLSEMIPALAPPLGSTMRMLLALGGGVSALALAAMVLGGKRARPAYSQDQRTRSDSAEPFQPRHAPNGQNPLSRTGDSPYSTPRDRDYGDHDMARQAPLARTESVTPSRRAAIREQQFDRFDDQDRAQDSGGFFSRVKASLSKLPLPRRFEEESDDGGPIRDFSDLKRLRPGGEDRQGGNASVDRYEAPLDRIVRPIAAHAELGEPLPPVTGTPQGREPMPYGADFGDDLAELERSARTAAQAAAPSNAPPVLPPVLQPLPTASAPAAPAEHAPYHVTETPMPAQPTPAAAPMSAPMSTPAAPVAAPVRYDAEGIDALVARLEQALAHVRPVPAAAPPSLELDLAGFAQEERAEDQRAEELRAEQQRLADERAAEQARQAAMAAEAKAAAEAKRRADALAAQEAARRAAEEADRAAEEARRRAEEAQSLLASLGVEQPAPAPTPATAPLRAVVQEQATAVDAEPEMDDALRSALRTLRRMSNP